MLDYLDGPARGEAKKMPNKKSPSREAKKGRLKEKKKNR